MLMQCLCNLCIYRFGQAAQGPNLGVRIVRIRPTFEPELWSVYQRTLDLAPRTTNHCEGFHSGFRKMVNVCIQIY